MELVEQEGMGCTRQCLGTGIEAVPQAEYSHGLWQWQSNAPEVLWAPLEYCMGRGYPRRSWVGVPRGLGPGWHLSTPLPMRYLCDLFIWLIYFQLKYNKACTIHYDQVIQSRLR